MPTREEVTESHLELVRQFLRNYGGDKGYRCEDIPPPPSFTPQTPTEQLFPMVYLQGTSEYMSTDRRTFEAWWAFFEYHVKMYRFEAVSPSVKSDPKYLRLLPARKLPQGICWVALDLAPADPFSGSLGDLWANPRFGPRLAGPELLAFAALSPGIVTSGGIYLGSYQVRERWEVKEKQGGGQRDWPWTLFLDRQGAMSKMELKSASAYGVYLNSMPPLVRFL